MIGRKDHVGFERQRLELGFQRGCQDLDVVGILVVGRQDAQRRLAAQLHHVPVHFIAHCRRRRRRILRIERHDKDAIAAALDQGFEPRGDRRVGIAHRPVDDDVRAERLERAGELAGLRTREGLDRQLVRLAVPDCLIIVRFAPRAQRQDDAVENELPQQRVVFDDARISEKLFQIAPYGWRIGRIGRAEIDQKHADAVFDRRRLRRSGRLSGWGGRRYRTDVCRRCACRRNRDVLARRSRRGGRRWRFNDVFGHRGGAFAGGNGRRDRGLVGGFASGGRHGRQFAHGFSLPLCAAAGPNDRADGRLFGGFQQRRRAGAELFKQSCFVGFCGSEMTLLDVTEAADFFRNGREADGEVDDCPASVSPKPPRAPLRSRRSACARCGARACGRTGRTPCRAVL